MVPVAGGSVWTDDTGDGPPVVLLHPAVGDAGFWVPVLPGLTARYRVIRYDVRGYGRSPASGVPYSPVADLVAVLDHLGLDRVSLVGCSMGGATALNLAVDHPDRVDRLVLLCPGANGYELPPDPATTDRMAPLQATGDLDGMVALAAEVWGAADPADPAILALLRSAVPAYVAQHEFALADPPVFGRLGEVRAPTVLMTGDRDRPMLIELSHEVARRIPGCRLVDMPGVDHFPTFRAPDLVLRTITRHLP